MFGAEAFFAYLIKFPLEYIIKSDKNSEVDSMKTEKYYIYLSTKERNEIVASLINLKNKLIEQGRYTDAVDDVLFKVLKTKRKKIKIEYV